MSKDIKHLKPSVDKTINMGIIDSWLRGICGMVPQSTIAKSFQPDSGIEGFEVIHLDVNTHNLAYGSHEAIEQQDIRDMFGFKKLITTCSENNVRLDLTDMGQGNLVVDFTPGEPFSSSNIFGFKYTNVIPGLFTPKR